MELRNLLAHSSKLSHQRIMDPPLFSERYPLAALDFEGATGKFAFDENRDPKMDLAVLEVKGGKWVPLGE